jgi:serine/threonine protein kinase
MHRANVIHRDIKLQNFMLDQNNDIVIIGKKKNFLEFLNNKKKEFFYRFWS